MIGLERKKILIMDRKDETQPFPRLDLFYRLFKNDKISCFSI